MTTERCIKNIKLIQCAYCAFCKNDQAFFAAYGEAIKRLTDTDGIAAIEVFEKHIGKNIDEDLLEDILLTELTAVDVSHVAEAWQKVDDITDYLSPQRIDTLINNAIERERKEQMAIINEDLRRGKIDFETAKQLERELPEFITADNIGFITVEDIMNTQVEHSQWTVDDIIPAGGLVVLAGEPASGKSMVMLDLCLTRARGDRWFDYETAKGKSVYIDMENAEVLIKERLDAFNSKEKDVYFITRQSFGGSIDLTNPAIRARLASILNRLELEKSDLVVFDSFRRMFTGNENDSEEVAKVMETINTITPATKVVLHHLRKPSGYSGDNFSPANRLRGSGDIIAAVDAVILLETPMGNPKVSTLSLSKVRWNAGVKPIEFKWANNDYGLVFIPINYSDKQKIVGGVATIIIDILKKSATSVSEDDLIAATGQSKKFVSEALATLVRENYITQKKINYKPFYGITRNKR